ncbi:RING-H2 finger protein ATL70-like [Neltuma alba]|uniref:RING-H2 finger protein ATL70-like n=1 Tax=Neltuma alba TaxID=207710 RepID=UPI0010A33D72|nr:RING-H2 finger protein ATL70-like [Prosopis alba]
MKEATGSGGFIASGFWYFVGVSFGVLVIITALTIVSYLCARSRIPITLPLYRINALDQSVDDDVQGIDEATILSYPKLLFCEARHRDSEQSHAATCCSICLSDYKDTDVVRMLPECGHLFHVQCIDTWLRMQPTCPNCRTSPFSTPPAQVVFPSPAHTPS